MVEWVERFYDEYYFRPKAAWRIVRKAIFDGAGAQATVQRGQGIHGSAREAQAIRGRSQSERADKVAAQDRA